MKIRNVFCSLVVAFAVVSVSQAATATDLDVVHTAYEAYEGAAKALERSIDVVHSKLNTAGLTPEEMQKLQLQLEVLLQTRVFDENGGSGTSVALHTNK